MTALCYNFATDEVPNGRAWRGLSFVSFQHSRGVAQPGRAPGSGPGGRRFKSSLPDQLSLFQSCRHNPPTQAVCGALHFGFHEQRGIVRLSGPPPYCFGGGEGLSLADFAGGGVSSICAVCEHTLGALNFPEASRSEKIAYFLPISKG